MTRGRAGFSLIELLIASVLTLVALGAVLATSSTTLSLFGTATRISRLQLAAARTAARLSADLRFADDSALVVSTQDGCGRIDFRIAAGFDAGGGSAIWSSVITYVVSPSSADADGNGALDEWQLERRQDGAVTIVCDHLAAGGFAVAQVDGRLDLSLTLVGSDRGNALSATTTTSIAPRNRS